MKSNNEREQEIGALIEKKNHWIIYKKKLKKENWVKEYKNFFCCIISAKQKKIFLKHTTHGWWWELLYECLNADPSIKHCMIVYIFYGW